MPVKYLKFAQSNNCKYKREKASGTDALNAVLFNSRYEGCSA